MHKIIKSGHKMVLLQFFIYIHVIGEETIGVDLCKNFHCDEIGGPVCGIRAEGDGYKLRLFQSECALLRHGCEAGSNFAFGITSMDYCTVAFNVQEKSNFEIPTTACIEVNCSSTDDKVCAIKNDGEGFRIRMFENECELWKFNCKNQAHFVATDLHICVENNIVTTEFGDGVQIDDIEITTIANKDRVTNIHDNSDSNVNTVANDSCESKNITDFNETNTEKVRNIFVIDGPMIDHNYINQTIDDFFTATHVFDLPVKEINGDMNENTRRRLVKTWGPVKVFKPWITIPKVIIDDFDHRPTLSSCYHKCPRKCPDTYAPVCGVPGTVAREPTLMFQNHCFMDVAQCKMYWENKSSTAISSSYIESSFLFCLGDQLNGVFRFLPLVRTLQHMGRLRSKGNYHYKITNMKFFNELLSRQPKLMG